MGVKTDHTTRNAADTLTTLSPWLMHLSARVQAERRHDGNEVPSAERRLQSRDQLTGPLSR